MRPAPNESVVRWVDSLPPTTLYTTSVTQAEILHGILRLPAGKRRERLAAAAEAMFEEDLAGRVLPFDSEAARTYALLVSERERRGRPISQFDAQIAAIARTARSPLATRNTSDYQGCGIELTDPWRR